MKKTVNMTASLKDVIWETLEQAAGQLNTKKNKSGLIEFEFNGCKVEMVIYSPEGAE